MDSRVPEQLKNEQQAVEAQIRDRFRGVGRVGGVSWSEAAVIDDWGSEEEQAAARATDTEKRWEDLVDDPAWDPEVGYGGFNFLDPIGFAYYIAPAMIRATRTGYGWPLEFHLQIDDVSRESRIACIRSHQARAVARFVRFMLSVHEAADDQIGGEPWKDAFEGYWKRFYG